MRHPRERRIDRRDFLARSAGAAAGLSGLASLLAACGGVSETAAPQPAAEPAGTTSAAEPAATGGGATTVEGGLQLARPDAPVTLPLFDDNPPIDSGLEPEGGPLKIYNWIDYLWKKKLNQFSDEFGVEVELTTFYTMDEAIQKLSTGAVDYDVFFPTTDRVGRLSLGKVLQPLNLEYVPNLANVWPALQSPFYDVGSQYTVPYVIFTTGISYRRDKVETDPFDLPNAYEIFWDTAYSGKTFLLDDAREALGMVMLKNGLTDLNTEDPSQIDAAKQELLELIDLVNVKVSIEDYTKIPEGSAWVHQGWSGDMVASPFYLPEGTDVSVLGYWYPPDGGGAIGSDQMAVLRSAKNPVLAHHFLNFMLDEKNAYENFTGFVGYQPPQISLDPERLIADGVVPENLSAAIVRESDFDKGYPELELSPEAAVLWQNAWAEFKAGV
jgi:spermidine/putrescine transport system substrate-binding protein